MQLLKMEVSCEGSSFAARQIALAAAWRVFDAAHATPVECAEAFFLLERCGFEGDGITEENDRLASAWLDAQEAASRVLGPEAAGGWPLELVDVPA